MSKYLVIVESPAKSKTIKKFIGDDYTIKASMGHIIDLPERKLGVDVEKGFEPEFAVLSEKSKILKELVSSARNAEKIYLATDPDREGEAIGWHLMRELSKPGRKFYRVVFHEITRKAIQSAFNNPGEINSKLVEAQQARRILDRLVGYKVSPLLWKRVGKGLSAGRVQTVALRIICERDDEVSKFIPQEYWTISAELAKSADVFKSKLFQVEGKKPEIKTREQAGKIIAECIPVDWIVKSVEKKEKKRYPVPPFTTSTLQQAAFRQLGFTAERTMRIAQQLYEGLEIGEEDAVGLITYMRTDSVRVAAESQAEAREVITTSFGREYLPENPPHYKSSKRAQEGHEAIRPTSAALSPEKISAYLSKDQLKLYRLIWKRFLASQINPAIYDITTIDVTAGPKYVFRVNGSLISFKGFLAVYEDQEKEENDETENESDQSLPELSEGDKLTLKELKPEQHFTQPPPRFTDALLVKALEEDGIGRPSTYAPTISTLIDRQYIERKEGKLSPTSLGKVVVELLVKHFPDIFNEVFTASMEEKLDKIEEGNQGRSKVLAEFYQPFKKDLEKAEKKMANVKKTLEEATDEKCEKCGSPMVIKWGRFGRFMACSAFPKCRSSKPISTGVNCPKDGCTGQLIPRRSKRGRIFYGCSKYPQCDFLVPEKPVAQECPKCHSKFLVETRRGKKLKCFSPNCGYEQDKAQEASAK